MTPTTCMRKKQTISPQPFMPWITSGWIVFFTLLGGSVLANVPLILLDQLYGTEDLNAYYRWSQQFSQALQEGIWQPRWYSWACEGLGSPAFLYRSSIFFYLVALVQFLCDDTWLAMRITVWLTALITGYIAWRGLKTVAPPALALLGSLCLQINPFAFHILNLHNLFTFYAATAPLLWMLLATLHFQRPRICLSLSLAIAALTLTHTLAAFLALTTLPFAFIPGLIRRSKTALAQSIFWGLSCLLGLGLAGYFIYPAMSSQHLIQTSRWVEPHFIDWHNSFIVPIFTAAQYGMRWKGVQWGFGSLVLATTMVLLFIIGRQRRAKQPITDFNLRACTILIASGLLASELSFLLWDKCAFLQMVQWPYRYLLVAVPSAIIGTATVMGNQRPRICQLAAAILGLYVLCSLAIQIKSLPISSIPHFPTLRVQDYDQVNTPGNAWTVYLEQGGLPAECATHDVVLLEQHMRTHERYWRFSANHEASLRLPLFHMPAWRVMLDGTRQPAHRDESSGLLMINLPAGTHQVVVCWALLPDEIIGRSISLASLMMLIILGWHRTRQKHTHPQ